MHVTLQCFRGVEAASLDLAPIALVCAANGGGKSSLAQAVALALTGEMVPSGLLKSNAGMLVRAGTGGASIAITREDGSLTVNWPQAKLRSEGKPPSSSPFAVGLRSVVDLDDKVRATTLIEYLRALPSREDLMKALEPLALGKDQAATLWKLVEDLGWDGAHKHVKERGVQFKGAWHHTTGEVYGSAKGETWQPTKWATDLAGSSEETLAAQVTQAREFLEAAIATTAVSDAERDRLVSLSASEIAHAEALEAAKAATVAARATLTGKRDALNLLQPPPAAQATQPCPHCQGALVVRGGRVEAPGPAPTEAERAAAQAGIAEATKAVRAAEADLATAQQAERDADRLLQGARDAAKRLAALPEPGDTAGDVDGARGALADAEARLAAFRAKTEADRLHRNIVSNVAIQAQLDPTGLRRDKLTAALGTFNLTLAALCGLASWGVVELADDLTVSYARRPWVLLSESEKFRVRVTLQVAMAAADKSDALVIDAADILDRNGRNGLFTLLANIAMPALVAMTMNRPEDTPDLAGNGLGCSYWIANGILRDRASAIAG